MNMRTGNNVTNIRDAATYVLIKTWNMETKAWEDYMPWHRYCPTMLVQGVDAQGAHHLVRWES